MGMRKAARAHQLKSRKKRKRKRRKNNCLTTRLNSSTVSPPLHHLYQNRDHVISYLLEACHSQLLLENSYTWRHLRLAFESCLSLSHDASVFNHHHQFEASQESPPPKICF